VKTTITSLALLALITSSAFAALNAPLPEFKNEKQLAEWRAEKASQSNTRSAAVETAFYTGKPYLASVGNYAFKYRNYSPEMARWTSEDPIGFPDGANQNIYAPSPTTELDSLGLFLSGTNYTWGVGGIFSQDDDKAAWRSLVAGIPTLVAKAMKYADGTNSGDWTLSLSDINLVKNGLDYIYGYTQQVVSEVSGLGYGAASTLEVNYSFKKPSECYYAFGDARLATSGQKTLIAGNSWGYNATVTLADLYTFSGYASTPWCTPTALGYRLQSHGYLREVNVSGSWNDNLIGAE